VHFKSDFDSFFPEIAAWRGMAVFVEIVSGPQSMLGFVSKTLDFEGVAGAEQSGAPVANIWGVAPATLFFILRQSLVQFGEVGRHNNRRMLARWSGGHRGGGRRACFGVFQHRINDMRMHLEHEVSQDAVVDFPLAVERG